MEGEKGQGKKTSEARSGKYTSELTIALTRFYINVSEDPIIENN